MNIAANGATNIVDAHSLIAENNIFKKALIHNAIDSAINSRINSKEVNNQKIDNNMNTDRNAPIGLFDSGIGGLSVYLHLSQQLPHERYIYYADTLHVPYGNRDSEDIKALTLNAVEWLSQQGCKLIVIACNSASAYALETARQHYPQLPIVGLVPAVKPAVLASKSAHVAVLATKATLNGALLNTVIAEIATPNGTKITKYFDPKLVPWVESGMSEDSDTAQNLRQQLQVFSQDGIDQLVLGCTHYPFFKDFIQQEIKQQRLSMQVVDSGQAIAERVKQLLVSHQLSVLPLDDLGEKDVATDLEGETDRRPLVFYATKYDKNLDVLLPQLLGEQTLLQYHARLRD